jgi:transglutaminase-like putative cysteine protease
MRFHVRHVTAYAYSSLVDLGGHIIHMRPRPLPHQAILSSSLSATPMPTRRNERLDHFGNPVTWLFLDLPHPTFEVVAEAVVDVRFPKPPAPDATPAWEEIAACAAHGGPETWQAAEFLFDSPRVPHTPAAGLYAAPTFTPGRPILSCLLELTHRIRTEFDFRSGVTSIRTPISTVLERRQGVCQDFTHLMIAALRAFGLPARYVSGYIRTKPPPGQTKRLGSDQSHAWVSAWMGPEHGWIDLDPTNDLVVAEEHVVLAWGRDYSDISPLYGIILGGGSHSLRVGVDLEAVGTE